jgi:hypothetical protein
VDWVGDRILMPGFVMSAAIASLLGVELAIPTPFVKIGPWSPRVRRVALSENRMLMRA